MAIHYSKHALLAWASLLASTAASTATAQETSQQRNRFDEDIIVTATRSATNLQSTPVAINVYRGEDLREQDVHDIVSLQTIDPSINITLATGTPYVAIRGVQSTNTTEVGNPSVSIARDGFFTNRSFTLGLAFYDLDRIEVLKGPQGTLFGRNSTGGLINVLSAKPSTGAIGGYVSATTGNYDLFGGEGALNLPLGDKLAVRVSGYGRSRDGYRRITGINIRGDDDKSYSGRVHVLWTPLDSLTLLARYQHDHLGGTGDVPAQGPVNQLFTGDPKAYPGYLLTSQDITADRVTWEANLDDLPFNGTLTYMGGTDLTDFRRVNDTSGTNMGVFTLAQFESSQRVRTVNHELRFATGEGTPFSLQFGAFYFRERNNPLLAGQLVATGPFAGERLITFAYDTLSTSKAVFGQASYEVTPALKLTLGGRYSWDMVRRTGTNALRCDIVGIPAFLCSGTPPALVTLANGRQKAEKFTYRAGLDWEISPNHFLYAKFDTGYKPGGFTVDPTNPNGQFGPETVDAFELGIKNRMFDDRLTLNANIFYQVLDGFQATVPVIGGSTTVNAGKTVSYGLELFTLANLTDRARVNLNMTYLHGRFGDNVQPVDNGEGGVIDISGNHLPNAPEWVIVAGIEQDIPIGASKITLRLDGKHSSSVYYDYNNRPSTRAPAYTTGNFSIALETPDDRWQAQIFIRNFTDKMVYGRIQRNALFVAQNFQFQPPRTFGLQVGYRF